MVTMKAIRAWRGQEGRVSPGDIIEVSEPRARQLEGHEQSSGRLLTATHHAEAHERAIKASARAVRMDEMQHSVTKGGPTGDHEKGRPQKPTEGAQIDESETPADAREESADEQTPAESGAQVNATPAARAMADQNGVDLTRVGATGAQGRVTKADVATHLGIDPQDA